MLLVIDYMYKYNLHIHYSVTDIELLSAIFCGAYKLRVMSILILHYPHKFVDGTAYFPCSFLNVIK